MPSFVWEFFAVKPDSPNLVTCNVCKNDVSRGSTEAKAKDYSTTPLHRHMENYHKAEYKARKQQSVEETEARLRPTPTEKKREAMDKQLSLMETWERKKIWDINDPRAKEIHVKIINMMAMDNQPFSMAEDDGFIQLMAHFSPTIFQNRRLIP